MVRLLTEDNPDFFTCSTADFRRRFSRFDMGLLPPYYLVAKPGKVLQSEFILFFILVIFFALTSWSLFVYL